MNEAFRPANGTAVAAYSTESNRTRSYALNRLAINLGWAAGGAMGGYIASIDYELLFWVDGITNIVAALLLLYFLPPSQNYLRPATDIQSEQPPRSAYSDRRYIIFILLTIVFATCFFQMFSTLTVYFKKRSCIFGIIYRFFDGGKRSRDNICRDDTGIQTGRQAKTDVLYFLRSIIVWLRIPAAKSCFHHACRRYHNDPVHHLRGNIFYAFHECVLDQQNSAG